MRIAEVQSWSEAVPLSRPYTIADRSISDVQLFFVRILSDAGLAGLGSASPAEKVTGESPAACGRALSEHNLAWLVGSDPRHVGGHCRRLERDLGMTPAARAAVDMALWDLFARALEVPLVDLLGRCHDVLPTSITIGIKPIDDALEEAGEYLARGFRCLKVKIGRSLERELELLRRLRERVGPDITVRVDANQGYSEEQAVQLWRAAGDLDLELIEQPLPAASIAGMRDLPGPLRRMVAADESLHDAADALALAQSPAACGIFNVKLMKCGGITASRAIAQIAECAKLDLMWGCNDESAVSIAAALHAAFACRATRYLDLDGSFDLARDPARGGFRLDAGCLRTVDAPGIGVSLGT